MNLIQTLYQVKNERNELDASDIGSFRLCCRSRWCCCRSRWCCCRTCWCCFQLSLPFGRVLHGTMWVRRNTVSDDLIDMHAHSVADIDQSIASFADNG